MLGEFCYWHQLVQLIQKANASNFCTDENGIRSMWLKQLYPYLKVNFLWFFFSSLDFRLSFDWKLLHKAIFLFVSFFKKKLVILNCLFISSYITPYSVMFWVWYLWTEKYINYFKWTSPCLWRLVSKMCYYKRKCLGLHYLKSWKLKLIKYIT